MPFPYITQKNNKYILKYFFFKFDERILKAFVRTRFS